MAKIATKTKILAWAVVGDKEKIDFDLCDFSPEQVGELDRLIRADGENSVRLTIDPEQKKLQIAPITASVRLVSLSCRGKGQKIKIGGFASPDERATGIKRLSAAQTPVVLTIEPIQGSLPFGRKDSTAEDAEGTEGEPEAFAEDPIDEAINFKIKCKGLKQIHLNAELTRGSDGWSFCYEIQLGNYQGKETLAAANVCKSRSACLEVLKSSVNLWLDNLQILGTSDSKRATQARRESMRDQVNAELDKRIEAARASAEPGETRDEDGQEDEDFEE